MSEKKNEWSIKEKISQVECPLCKYKFILRWNEYSYGDKKQTLIMRWCPSGGIYDCLVRCPKCDYEEDL